MPVGNPWRRTHLAGLLVVVVAIGTGLSSAGAGVGVQASGEALEQVPTQRTGVELELIEQGFSLEPTRTLRLVYLVTGDIETVAELTPIDPTLDNAPASTVPPTTLPETTGPETTGPDTDPTTTVPPPPLLTVDIANYAPLTRIAGNESYLDAILGQDPRPGAFRDNVDGVGDIDIREQVTVIDENTAMLTIEVPTDLGIDPELRGAASLEFPEPGLYPIRVQLLVDGDVAATHGTIVDRLPSQLDNQRASAPINLAVVANVARPTASQASVERSNDQFDRVVDLAATIESPVLAAVPPPVLRYAVEEGSSDIASGSANLELVALTDIALDVSSAVAANQGPTYARHLRTGEELLTELAPTIPSRRDVWIAAEPLSAAGAQRLRDIGIRFIIMTPDLYATLINENLPDDDRFVEMTLPDGGSLPIILVNELSDEFTAAATAETLAAQHPTEWAVHTMAEIVLTHRQNGRTVERSRIISTPDLDAPDPRLLAALETIAETTPYVRFIAASQLTGATGTQRAPGGNAISLPDTAGPDLTRRVERIDSTRLELISAKSMLPASDGRFERWDGALSELISTGITDNDANAVIDGLLAEAAALRDAIILPEPFTFTLTGRSDEITLRLGNRSDQPLTVVVRLSSSKLTFPDNDRVVTLRPNDNTDIQIRVRARSNGTSAVMVEVLTPLGQRQVDEPVTLTSRVNALTGFGQVLTGGFLLVLLTWWFSSWRKRRQERNDGNDDEHDEVNSDTIDDDKRDNSGDATALTAK